MILAIEGSDGAGKSTLAAQLQADLPGSTLLHRGPPKLSMLEEYEQSLDWLVGMGTDVVCDRWHLGELVYGPLLRGKCLLSAVERWHIDMYLHARGGMIVWVNTPLAEVRRRFHERGDDLIRSDQLGQIYQAYGAIMLQGHCPVIGLTSSGVEAARLVMDQVNDLRATDALLSNFATYIGGPKPSVLLLGERRKSPERYEAAFVPEPSTSGRFLLEALSPSTWRTGELGIANAADEDVAALWETLGRPAVVTLGVVAHKAADHARVPHEKAAHPQFVRRFHHKQKEEYGMDIKRLGGVA